MTAQILALCNQKGGVGKTTTTFHLARAAVLAGRRVLAVDLDAQGNLTSILTAEEVDQGSVGLADVLSARANEAAADVIVPGLWPGLDVLPSAGDSLSVVGEELAAGGPGRESRLRGALAAVQEDYDLILIDCPPALSQLTINGLTAAHGVLIVTETKLFSSNGLAGLLRTIGLVREHYNPVLTIAGCIINKHEARTVTGRHWAGELASAAEASGFTILEPPVPKRAEIGDSSEASTSLDEWKSADAAEFAAIYAGYLATIEGARA